MAGWEGGMTGGRENGDGGVGGWRQEEEPGGREGGERTDQYEMRAWVREWVRAGGRHGRKGCLEVGRQLGERQGRG